MAFFTRYARPDMVDLPNALGKAIFKQILSTPKPDDEWLNEETSKFEKEMLKGEGFGGGCRWKK